MSLQYTVNNIRQALGSHEGYVLEGETISEYRISQAEMEERKVGDVMESDCRVWRRGWATVIRSAEQTP